MFVTSFIYTYRTKYCFDYDDLGSSLFRIHVILKRLINATFGIVQKYIDQKEIYVFVYLNSFSTCQDVQMDDEHNH